MIDRTQAQGILREMVRITRDFRIAGQRSRQRSLTGTTFGVLQQLRDGDARLGELAAQRMVSASVASRAVDSLELDGMVRRNPDPRDARAVLISITPQGWANVTERETYFVGLFADALSDWSAEDAQQAITIMAKLNTHLSDLIESLTPGCGSKARPIPGQPASHPENTAEDTPENTSANTINHESEMTA